MDLMIIMSDKYTQSRNLIFLAIKNLQMYSKNKTNVLISYSIIRIIWSSLIWVMHQHAQ